MTFCHLRWHLLAQMPSRWQNVRSLRAASKANSWSMPSLSWNQQGATSQCAVLTKLVHLRGVGQGTSCADVELELSEVDEVDDLGQLGRVAAHAEERHPLGTFGKLPYLVRSPTPGSPPGSMTSSRPAVSSPVPSDQIDREIDGCIECVGDRGCGVVDDVVGSCRAYCVDTAGACRGDHLGAGPFASWTTNPPTPPPAPLTSTRCPATRLPCSNSACQAVSAGTGIAAASVSAMVAGANTSSSAACGDVFGAGPGTGHGKESDDPGHRWPDPRCRGRGRRLFRPGQGPTCEEIARAKISSMAPARNHLSTGLNAVAATATSTSPGPGRGVWGFFVAQDVDVAVLVKTDGLHGIFS